MTMDTQIKLSTQIAPHYHNHFLSKKPHQAHQGGRGSTKTSMAALKVAWTAISEENCAIVVLRKHTNKIRRSVYKEVLRAFRRLGVSKSKLKATVSPFEITYLPNGNPIYFTGVGEIDDIKGMIDEDRPIKLVWLEELTQFEDEYEILHIVATFARGNDDFFITLYTWNAPEDLYHWIFNWLEKMGKRLDFLTTNTTYLTVPAEWLGKLFIQEAEAVKFMDIDYYNHIYLNLPIRLRGMVYKKWDEAIHVVDTKKEFPLGVQELYSHYTIGVDYGETDATSFTMWGYRNNFSVQRPLRHYYHKNGYTDGVIGLPFLQHRNREHDIDDYLEDFYECVQHWHGEFPNSVFNIYIDSANKTFIQVAKKWAMKNKIRYIQFKPLNKQKEDLKSVTAIEERIRMFTFMLRAATCKLSNHPSLYELRKAISQCRRNDKGERKDDGTQNIDSLDSMEYGFKMLYNRIKQAVIQAAYKLIKEE